MPVNVQRGARTLIDPAPQASQKNLGQNLGPRLCSSLVVAHQSSDKYHEATNYACYAETKCRVSSYSRSGNHPCYNAYTADDYPDASIDGVKDPVPSDEGTIDDRAKKNSY